MTEYWVQQDLLVRFKSHRFSLLNSYNLPIYRLKHGFQRSETYLVIYKLPSDVTLRGHSRFLWTVKSWIHRLFCRFQIWPTLSGHQEHEYSHTRCCCSARSARYRCGSCSFSNYTMHCICKFLPPPQGRFYRFPLLPWNFLRQNSGQHELHSGPQDLLYLVGGAY